MCLVVVQRKTGIKADFWIAANQRIIDKSLIIECIVNDQWLVRMDGMGAEGPIAALRAFKRSCSFSGMSAGCID